MKFVETMVETFREILRCIFSSLNSYKISSQIHGNTKTIGTEIDLLETAHFLHERSGIRDIGQTVPNGGTHLKDDTHQHATDTM